MGKIELTEWDTTLQRVALVHKECANGACGNGKYATSGECMFARAYLDLWTRIQETEKGTKNGKGH